MSARKTASRKPVRKTPVRTPVDKLDPGAFARAWVRTMELEKELLAVGPPLVLGRKLLRGLSGQARLFPHGSTQDVTHEITWGISMAFRTMVRELRVVREAVVAMRNEENDTRDNDPVMAICGLEARCELLAEIIPNILRANGMMTPEYKTEAAK